MLGNLIYIYIFFLFFFRVVKVRVRYSISEWLRLGLGRSVNST